MKSALVLSAVGLGSVVVVVAYIGKRRLDRACPVIPFEQIPQSSACRYFVESSRGSASGGGVQKAWGLEFPGLLASWSSAAAATARKSRWIPSFVAVQAEVPVSLLTSYRAGARDAPDAGDSVQEEDADHLMRNLVAAFLDGRARGPDGWLLDKEVPPLSFAPGTHLFGNTTAEFAAFMLGTWSSRQGSSVQPSALPSGAVEPVSEFPSNSSVIRSKSSPTTDAAGTVIYWIFPDGLVRATDMLASYGSPWRLVDGGFQEFIVERVSDEKGRVTYIAVECSNLHPNGKPERDFKTLPKLIYAAHVLYAQSLLLRAVWQMKRA